VRNREEKMMMTIERDGQRKRDGERDAEERIKPGGLAHQATLPYVEER